jgi:ferredoxin/flavodoxin---NADP+ reductase
MAWVESKIIRRHDWAPGLITLALDRVAAPYVPGQFVNLGLDRDGIRIKRSYSLASAAGEFAEFYITEVTGGDFTPDLFRLRVGDALWLDDRALGFFTLDYVPPARHLWLLATGTGLGPFIAMLRSPGIWQRFERIVLVHGVRELAHLGYAAELAEFMRERPGKFSYLPVVTREAAPVGVQRGRLPALIVGGELERAVGLALEPEGTHVLLCGNPAMIGEVQAVLEARGMHKHRPRKPGHISFESYW